MPQTNDSQLAYQDLGPRGAPAVMLLHGFLSCNAQWLPNLTALSEHYRLVMVELWGHGDSPLPKSTESFSIKAYIDQFEAIRKVLQIDHWNVIGQSYGAGIVLNYAANSPAQVHRVVVTNSRSAFGDISAGSSGGKKSPTRPSPKPGAHDLRTLPYHPIHARRFPAHIKQALVDKADAIPHQAVENGGRLGAQLNCVDLLERLPQSFLVINGMYERAFQTDLNALLARYPTLPVANLPGGHSVNIEAADGFNDAVVNFFNGTAATPRTASP